MQTSYELPSSDYLGKIRTPKQGRAIQVCGQPTLSQYPAKLRLQSVALTGGEFQLVRCKPDELQLRTSCTHHKLTVPAWKLSALENLSVSPFERRRRLREVGRFSMVTPVGNWQEIPFVSSDRSRSIPQILSSAIFPVTKRRCSALSTRNTPKMGAGTQKFNVAVFVLAS